jgi:hypothetical protein
MRLTITSLSLAVVVAAAPAAQPGLEIVTRETLGATIIDTTEYIGSDRSCIETRVAAARLAADGVPRNGDVEHHRSARITRCDLRKAYVLSYDDRTYMTDPLPAHPSGAHMFLASLLPAPPPTANRPDLVIETTTVRTGERKMAFGYAARRVITTRRDLPRDASGGQPGEIETDGWYIDLDTRPSCERSELTGARVMLVGATSNAGHPAAIRTVTFKEVGAPERGFPIEVTTTSRIRAGAGLSREHTVVTYKVVTELSSTPLDPMLFEIPSGFRRAGGPLAALSEHWSRVWMTTKGLVAAWFR